MTKAVIIDSLTAVAQFTSDESNVTVAANGTTGLELRGSYNVTISGTFVATLTLQRSFDDGTTWENVATFTVPGTVEDQTPEAGVIHRIGITAFTSGVAVVRLSQ